MDQHDLLAAAMNVTLTRWSPLDPDDVTNASVRADGGDNATAPLVCVLCKYRLDPWLKGVRVGFGSLIVLANLVVFVCLRRAAGLPTSLRLFLSNVSVLDGLYGLGFLYHSAIVDFPAFIVMNLECKLRYGFLCMVSMVAMFTLMAMCVERVISLQFPFSYQRLVTKTNLRIALFFFWLLPFTSVLPAYVLIEGEVGECNFVRFIAARSFLAFSVTYLIFMIVTVICQTILYFTAKRQIKKIIPTLVGDHRKETAFRMTVKATSTTLSMAVPFVISSTPKVVTYMYLAFNSGQRIRVESLTTLAITVYLNVSHSLINPFIYIYRLPQVRAQFFSLFLGKNRSLASDFPDDPKLAMISASDSRSGKTVSSSETKVSDRGFYSLDLAVKSSGLSEELDHVTSPEETTGGVGNAATVAAAPVVVVDRGGGGGGDDDGVDDGNFGRRFRSGLPVGVPEMELEPAVDEEMNCDVISARVHGQGHEMPSEGQHQSHGQSRLNENRSGQGHDQGQSHHQGQSHDQGQIQGHEVVQAQSEDSFGDGICDNGVTGEVKMKDEDKDAEDDDVCDDSEDGDDDDGGGGSGDNGDNDRDDGDNKDRENRDQGNEIKNVKDVEEME